MASVNETKHGHEYRVVVFGGGLVFKIYDGEGKGTGVIENLNPADNMTDRVMEEIGDSFPFQTIEGGRAAGINDGQISSSKEILHLVWDSIRDVKNREGQKPANSFLDRVNRFFKRK